MTTNQQDQAVILTLAKVLVAAAWADGELSNDEINSMKRDLLTKIPNLSTQQWASVAIYMDSPVDEAERTRLVQQLRSQITTPLGKQLVFEALDDLVAPTAASVKRNAASSTRSRPRWNPATPAVSARCPRCSRDAARPRR